MIAILRFARGAVSLAILGLNTAGAVFRWVASLLVPAQKFLTRTIERRSGANA